MKSSILSILFLLSFHLAFPQEKIDSARQKAVDKSMDGLNRIDSLRGKTLAGNDSLRSFDIPGNSASRAAMNKADAIRSDFQSKADSLELSYRKPLNKMDSLSKSLQHKIDSLQTVRLPTTKLASKLDSVNAVRTTKVAEMNQKIDNFKQKASKDLNALELPPQMKEPVQKLTQSINGYKIPVVNGKIPGLDASAKLPGFHLPNGNLNSLSPGKANVPGVTGPAGITSGAGQITNQAGEISKVGGQVKEYAGDLNKIKQGNIPDVKSIDKEAEKQVLKNAPVGELSGKTGQIDQLKKQLSGRPDSAAMGMAKQEVMKEAKNHFKGQEAALQQGMDQLGKIKAKYGDVKDMKDLLKKEMNPLHDTPFIERLVPGIGFQILSSGAFLLDANASIGYRISPKFTAAAGWVQRLNFGDNKTDRNVYGPRVSVQFNIPKGFSFRFVPEVLNTYVPPQFSANPNDAQRQWVGSVFVGLKKDFKVYKRMKGYTEALYNLYNPDHKSPYQDALVVRFGFEFQIKK